MKLDIQELLVQIILNAIKESGFATDSAKVILDFPSDARFGDLSTNIALQLSKTLKKAPRDVAAVLVDGIKQGLLESAGTCAVKEVRIEGAGFINFYLTESYFYGELDDCLTRGQDAFKSAFGAGKRVMVEFVSANPTGPLSVAHARQAAVGDALANILNFLGFKAEREYYLNDEGNQINVLGKSVELRLKELSGETIVFPEECYQGDYIRDIARQIKDRGITVTDFSEYGATYILEIIKKELEDFGVRFDCWYSQKSLRTSGKIEEALGVLKQKGFLYEEEGALWFKSTAFGDDKDRVVIKSDGTYTYLAPDIAYHKAKYERGFEWLINLWGPDHHGYIPRLSASIEAFGHAASTLSVVIVQLATIFRQGKPVKMSTRCGQYITLREVLDEVGLDAARFFFLMRRTQSHLDFDLDVAKKQSSENPVYYVQYAFARISSILNGAPGDILSQAADFSLLKEKEELDLIKKIVQFQSVLHVCVKTEDPYMLTVYLQELAETFHKFYDKHRVLSDNLDLTRARLGLIAGVRLVIATGLELLGITRPEKM